MNRDDYRPVNRDEYYSKRHKPTAAARRREKRRVRQREANRKPENFGRINWRAYTHRQLWDMVKSADLAQMSARTYAWKKLAAEIDEAAADVRKIAQQLAMSWRGPSAVAAAGSASRLTEWGADASKRAFAVGDGLDSYTWAVGVAARNIPVPVHPDAERWFADGYDVTTLDGPQGAYLLDQLLDDHMPTKKEQQEAMERAVRVMEEYEAASRGVQRELPTFDQAPDGARIDPDHRSVPPPPPHWSPERGPHREQGPDAGPAPDRGSEPDRPSAGGTTSVAAAGPSFGLPGGSGGSGVAGGPGGYGAFGGTGHGAYGAGGQGGPFGPVGPGGASGVLGPVPGGAAARGGAGPVVGAGGPQGFGMYPPMAPGNREEDAEHRNRYDSGLDLLDDLPPAFPPVLGE